MTYRVGIIGVGFGRQVHVPAFRADSRCRVHALCASRIEKAEQAAKPLQVPRAYGDWRQLVDDPEVDVVSIAVPPALQPAMVAAACERGKHVFCEKPLGGGSVAGRALFETARKNSAIHMVDFEFPELDTWRTAREWIAANALGALRHVGIAWHVETYAHRHRLKSWKTTSASGGGALNVLGCHTLFYLEWLFGPLENLCARLLPNPAADHLDLLWLQTRSGVPISASIGANSFLGNGHRLEIYGEEGTLVLSNPTRDYISGFVLKAGTRADDTLREVRKDPPEVAAADGRIWAVGRMVRRFLDGVERGEAVSPGLEEALRVEALMEAVRRAHDQGSWMEI